MTKEQPIMEFSSPEAWREWLLNHHDTSSGIWFRFYKKNSGLQMVNYDQALDEALCFGWIDGQTKKYDELSYLQRFTKRRPQSIWSKRNTEHIARLQELGKLHPSGIQEVENAKRDGRWEKAYDGPSTMQVPNDFLIELAKHPKAEAFFKTLNKTNTFAISFQITTAKKEETRQRRIQKYITLLEKEEKLY